MRPALAFAFMLAAAPAFAQTPLTGTSGVPTSNTPPLSGTAVEPGPAAGPPSGPEEGATPGRHKGGHGGHHEHHPLAERFAAANTTHDGHLTLAQAHAAHMSGVVRDFGLIDKQKRGYVTVEDIQTFRKERRAARAAAEAR